MSNNYRLLLAVFFSLLFVTGCSSQRTFYFIDENGMPVKDVLVVAEECEIACFFTDNRIMINKTNEKGCVRFYLDGFAYCDGGKIGYYPVSFRSLEKNTFCPFIASDPFLILIRKDYGQGYPYLEYEKIFLGEKVSKPVIKSALWKDWFFYLRWLDEEQNYFEKNSPKIRNGEQRTFDMSGKPL